MIDAELLKILCCPETRQSLRLVEPSVLERINEKIANGQINSRLGKTVTERCDGGLIREDGRLLYPVRGNIPILLISEAIPL